MKHLNKFNESSIVNPHAWRSRPVSNEDKEPNMLDIVRSGDVEALESYLQANKDRLQKFATMAAKFSAPGTRNENTAIYDYVMDNYDDAVDMEAVAKWLRYDKKKPEVTRDIDAEGNDWYYFDHPEDMKESNSMRHLKRFEGVIEKL